MAVSVPLDPASIDQSLACFFCRVNLIDCIILIFFIPLCILTIIYVCAARADSEPCTDSATPVDPHVSDLLREFSDTHDLESMIDVLFDVGR